MAVARVLEGFLHKGNAQGKRIPCRQHNEGEERRFPARFLVMEHYLMDQKLLYSIFCLTVPNPFKEILHIFRIQASKMSYLFGP